MQEVQCTKKNTNCTTINEGEKKKHFANFTCQNFGEKKKKVEKFQLIRKGNKLFVDSRNKSNRNL